MSFKLKTFKLSKLGNKYGYVFGLIVISLGFSACSGDESEPEDENQRAVVRAVVEPQIIEVVKGGTASVTVDLTGWKDDSVATEYTIDLAESAGIAINSASCTAGQGSSNCRVWTISAGPNTLPGEYRVRISPEVSANDSYYSQQRSFIIAVSPPASLAAPAAVSISGNGLLHILTTDNHRWSWGGGPNRAYNAKGQVGVGGYSVVTQAADPRAINAIQPEKIYLAAEYTGDIDWLAVDGNRNLGLGLTVDGQVYSWGSDENSLALGYTASLPQALPREVPELTGVTAVAAGKNFSLALREGQIVTWGSNYDGMLGLGTTNNNTEISFEALTNPSGVIQISASRDHVLALADVAQQRAVWSWGLNADGQLGLGAAIERQTSPALIEDLADIDSILAGEGFSLALDFAGNVWAWGGNDSGQLGNGTTVYAPLPQAVPGLEEIRAIGIDAAAKTAYAIDDGYSLWRWGGRTDNNTADLSPVRITQVQNVITAGSGYAITGDCEVGGFLWDISASPPTIPTLIPYFGRDDAGCPSKLFVHVLGEGEVALDDFSCGGQVANCSWIFPAGSTIDFDVAPAPGWSFDPQSGYSGMADCLDGSVDVTGPVQCIISFTQGADTRLVSIDLDGAGNGVVTSAPSGLNCGDLCQASFDTGSTVSFTATPDANSLFVAWSGDNQCTANADGNQTSVTVDTDLNCLATFNLLPVNSVQLTVNSAGNGAGWVSSTPAGINECYLADATATPEGCNSYLFENIESVVLLPSADEGSNFSGWSGCDRLLTNDGPDLCEVDSGGERAVTVDFELDDPVLTIVFEGEGSGVVENTRREAVCEPNANQTCTFSAEAGTEFDLVPFPDDGAVFGGWGDGHCDQDYGVEGCSLILESNRTVSVTFVPQTYNLTVDNAGTAGIATLTSFPAGIADCVLRGTEVAPADCNTAAFAAGSTVKIAAEPDDSSDLLTWIGCDSIEQDELLGELCVVDSLSSDRTVSAGLVDLFTSQPPTFNATLVLEFGGSGIGTVQSSPFGIDCTSTDSTPCLYAFPYGTQVYLTPTANANAGSSFGAWGVDDCDQDLGVEGCVVNMDGDRQVQIEFDAAVFVIDAVF